MLICIFYAGCCVYASRSRVCVLRLYAPSTCEFSVKWCHGSCLLPHGSLGSNYCWEELGMYQSNNISELPTCVRFDFFWFKYEECLRGLFGKLC